MPPSHVCDTVNADDIDLTGDETSDLVVGMLMGWKLI